LLNLFLPSFHLRSFDKYIPAKEIYGKFHMGNFSEIYLQASVLGNTWQVKNFFCYFRKQIAQHLSGGRILKGNIIYYYYYYHHNYHHHPHSLLHGSLAVFRRTTNLTSYSPFCQKLSKACIEYFFFFFFFFFLLVFCLIIF
jgi:hypothetical protein